MVSSTCRTYLPPWPLSSILALWSNSKSTISKNPYCDAIINAVLKSNISTYSVLTYISSFNPYWTHSSFRFVSTLTSDFVKNFSTVNKSSFSTALNNSLTQSISIPWKRFVIRIEKKFCNIFEEVTVYICATWTWWNKE